MTVITSFNRLLTSGERSDLAPPSPSRPLSHQEKIERLIELIVEKQTPRLKGRIRVELVKSDRNFRVQRNGRAILIQLSVLPNDKRFPEILQKFSVAARRMLSARPFDIPAPKMEPTERRGWEGLLGIGAHISRGGTALDLRAILPHDPEAMARFLHFWQLVSSGPTNVAIRNREGDPIGVYTKERLS